MYLDEEWDQGSAAHLHRAAQVQRVGENPGREGLGRIGGEELHIRNAIHFWGLSPQKEENLALTDEGCGFMEFLSMVESIYK